MKEAMALNTNSESETNKDYYEKGSSQVAQVTAVQLRKLEQVCIDIKNMS